MFSIEMTVKSIRMYAMISRLHFRFQAYTWYVVPLGHSVLSEGKEEANRLFPLSAP